MARNEDFFSAILVEEGDFLPFSTPQGLWIQISDGVQKRIHKLDDGEAMVMAVKSAYKKRTGEYLSDKECLEEIGFLKLYAFETKLSRNLEQRMAYRETNDTFFYDLDAFNGKAVKITAKGYKIVRTPSKTFLQNDTYKAQVKPDKTAVAEELPRLLKAHFTLQNQDQLLLLSTYLVGAFMSPVVKCPVLIFIGDKGSSKSTIMRRIESIIDPKYTDLTGVSNSNADLQIQLANNRFVSIDNVSRLSQKTSDLLARAITGGSASKRKLYTDNEEVFLNLRCLVAINGIHLFAKSNDLLDRALLFRLKRISPTKIKEESEQDKTFAKDLPKIMGAIFDSVSRVMADKKPVEFHRKIRMVDFFDAAIKIGRTFGLEDEKMSRIIWKNHEEVNKQSLQENLVAQCLQEIMSDRTEYTGSVTELLHDLHMVAEDNSIRTSFLPGQPNVLSRKLNEIKSNLEEEGISYEIKNVGAFRQIHIVREDKKSKNSLH